MKNQSNLVALLTVKRDDTYGNQARFELKLTFKTINDAGKIRNVSAYDGELSDFADLEIYGAKGNGLGEYAFSLEYRDIYTVNYAVAARIAKFLGSAYKRYDKLVARYGHPKNFATFANYMLDAIGVDRVIIDTSKNKHSDWDDANWEYIERKSLDWRIENLTRVD